MMKCPYVAKKTMLAEGIVARPHVDLLDRGGNRIIAKIKCRDFH